MAWAQNRQVSGTVIDDIGEPLIGVSVLQKNTTNGTVTNFNGEFEISVPENAVLLFSYIGYMSQEINVGNRTTLNITMGSDTQALDEVVVVGYGVQKKSSVTGAISQVKSEDMINRTITRPEQALQGKTAGVQVFQASAAPGSSPTIRIRGISSNGSSDPLYVVDGRITEDIGGLDPNDIESMEVLKDAASAAIYGASAGNGVVLITTKKGKVGVGTITYDFQISTQKISRIPKVLNAEQYIDYMTEANYLTTDAINTYWDGKTNTDWSKVAFENSLMQKHNLSLQGGSKEGTYYMSLSYLDNDGYIKGNADKYKRLTATINADYHIKPWLQVGTNTQIEHYKVSKVSEGSEYGSMLMSVLQLDPLTPSTYAPDQLPDYMQANLNNGYTLLKDEKGDYYSTSAFQNSDQYHPLIMRDKSTKWDKGFNVNSVIYGNLKPFEGLTITSRFGFRLSGLKSYAYNQNFYVNPTINQKWMEVTANASIPIYYQWENFANYNKSIDKHSFNGMVGMSFIENRTFNVYGAINGSESDLGFSKNSPLYAYFDYATSNATKNVTGGEEVITRKLAYFGRVSYDYDNKYMLQASLRADAADTSILPQDKRWGYFPAVSAGWDISREHFMEGLTDKISHLKLRASWGQNGTTVNLQNYQYATSVAFGSYPMANGSYSTTASLSSLGNYKLKWETSEQTDIGLDARFLSDRLTFSFDYFDKRTKDLIMTGITPSTVVGNEASPINAGNVSNKGVEIELGWRDNFGDFSYSVRGNLATLKNKVTSIHESLDRINGTNFHMTSGITAFEEGYPTWYFRGYKFQGIDPTTGDPTFEDLNNDGIINDSDRTNIGSGIPDFTYGITLTAAYKGFDLTVFGTGAQGNDIFMVTNRGDRLQANMLKEFYDDRWTTTNTSGTQPRAGAAGINNYWVSDAVVYDGSYFKIKQIQLGYSLPKSLLKKARINNLRVYCSLDDFVTITSYPGFDPEIASGSGTYPNEIGVDKGGYPSSKKVVFGLNVSF